MAYIYDLHTLFHMYWNSTKTEEKMSKSCKWNPEIVDPDTCADVSEVTRDVEFVTYSVDGQVIEDDSSGSDRATGPDFAVSHTFEGNPHGRLLVARAFDEEYMLLVTAMGSEACWRAAAA